jgi:hypothetical protein
MPSTEAAVSELPAVDELREQLKAASGGDDQGLFVLLDGARIPKLWVMLREFDVENAPLLRPSPEEDLSHVSPFVAHCTAGGDLLTWLAIDSTVLEAAVFLVADGNLEEVRDHLRRFLLVEDHQRNQRYLRFYDPRVLPTLLSASTNPERRRFFGPVRSFLACDPDASRSDRRLRLRQWVAPGPDVEDPRARPPTATARFKLRAEHEVAFARDAMERYDDRCVGYLRGRYPERLREEPDGEIRALVARAKALGPTLGFTNGHDITIVAELLVMGFDERSGHLLEEFAGSDRSAALARLRDRLFLARPA